MTDTNGIAADYFKGPFKGKGKNRQAIQSLENDLETLRAEMKQTIVQFKAQFARYRTRGAVVAPGRLKKPPISLSIMTPRGIPLLRWRLADPPWTPVKLFDSDNGRVILEILSQSEIRKLAEYDRLRLYYNPRTTVVGTTLEQYRRYVKSTELLEQWLVEGAHE